MTRDQLIAKLESLFPCRDSDIGAAWAYLSAGCEFSLHGDVLEIDHKHFGSFETGDDPEMLRLNLSRCEPEAIPNRMPVYDRGTLIGICRAAIVPEPVWCNRDSPQSIRSVGECLQALLRGDAFEVRNDPTTDEPCLTDDQTIWLDVGGETFYLPTPSRLSERAGRDWY